MFGRIGVTLHGNTKADFFRSPVVFFFVLVSYIRHQPIRLRGN